VHIQTELVSRLGPNTRKARPADIYLLKRVNAPAALVEVGFLSNPREERLLADAAYRERVAEAIFHGIVAYFADSPKSDGAAHMLDDDPGNTWGDSHKGRCSRVSAHSRLDDPSIFGGPTNFDDSLMPEVREIPGLTAMDRTEALAAVLHATIAGPGTRQHTPIDDSTGHHIAFGETAG